MFWTRDQKKKPPKNLNQQQQKGHEGFFDKLQASWGSSPTTGEQGHPPPALPQDGGRQAGLLPGPR